MPLGGRYRQVSLYYSSESVHGYNNHDNWHANLHTSFTYLPCYIMVGNRYTLLKSSLVVPFGNSSHKIEDVWYILLEVKKTYDFQVTDFNRLDRNNNIQNSKPRNSTVRCCRKSEDHVYG